MPPEQVSVGIADAGRMYDDAAARYAIGPDCVLACVRDLIHESLTAPGTPRDELVRRLYGPGSGTVLADLEVGAGGLGLDSLDRITAASAVARFFDLGASGVDEYLLHAERLGEWARLIAHHFSAVGGEARITVMTSGSTGVPQACTHLLRDLFDEVIGLVPRLNAMPPTRVVSMVPVHHLYGFLWSALLPSLSGAARLDVARAPASMVLRRLQAGDLIVATPFGWQTLVDQRTDLPDGVNGLVSAAPMPAALWAAVNDRGIDTLTEIYGASETAGVGWRQSPNTPFTMMPNLERAGDGIRLRARPLDRLVQDQLIWDGPCAFRLDGRNDAAVQVAGTNVSLSHVRDTLLSAPGVADAAVRLDSGRLAAFVVPDKDGHAEGCTTFKAALSRWIEGRLAVPARPVTITLGDCLPRNAMGKLAPWHPKPPTENSADPALAGSGLTAWQPES